MKPEDLMIHDWVSYKGKMLCKITAICKDTAVVDNDTTQDWRIDYGKLTTILLTPEILEKNGFVEFTPDNWQIVIDNIMIELRAPEHNMAIWLDWDEQDTGTYASYMFPRPNCVHELQHALRLCGINKTIEL